MIDNNMELCRIKLAKILSATLSIPLEAVDESLSSETVVDWDSIRHLTIILAVEEAFGVTFSERQIPTLNSFVALLGAIAVGN